MDNNATSDLICRVVQKMKQMILSGSLVNTLPGERILGHQLSVGRETVRKALAVLEEEQWIAKAETKSAREILMSPENTAATPLSDSPFANYKRSIIAFITPLPLRRLHQSVLAELYTIQKILEEDGITVRIYEAPWILSTNPDKRLAKLVSNSNCICWLLHRSSEQSQLWFQKHQIPCIVRGTSYQSSGLPYLDRHWAAITHHAASFLWKKGHRKVGLCLSPEALKGHQLMEKGFMTFNGDGWKPIIVNSPYETPDFFKSLTETFHKHPDITAMVASRGNQIVPLLSYAEAHKLTIPDQLSLVSLTYEPFMDRIFPSICFYEENTTKTVHKLIGLIRGLINGKKVRSVSIIPELNIGGSVANK